MDDVLRDVVLALNPWLADRTSWKKNARKRLPKEYVPRTIHDRVKTQWGNSNMAHLLVGPRQAGKTTLIWKHLMDSGLRPLFLTAEDLRVRRWCESPALFVRDLHDGFDGVGAIFLDEVQHLLEAGLFVKGVVDLKPGCPVFVTGSSSYQLRSRTRESLAGRATRTTLLPFSLLEASGGSRKTGHLGRAVRDAEFDRLLERHVRFGGYPLAWLSNDPETVLDGLVEAFLIHDASDFFRIERPDAMRRIMGLAAGQVGNLVNLSEWASICGIARDTVQAYIQILEDSHLVGMLPVFVGGKRAELTASKKAYFVDNGIRNAIARDFRPPDQRVDAGPVMENWVYSELRKRVHSPACLYYWRTRSGAEVDFVVDTGRDLLGIEVKAADFKTPRISRSSRSFIKAYAPREFYVLNAGLDHVSTISGTRVRWLPFRSFALQDMEWE